MNKVLIGFALLTSISLFASNMSGETFKSEVQRKVLENRLNLSDYVNEVALEDISLNEFRNRIEEKVLANRQAIESNADLNEEIQALLEESDSELESFRSKLRLKVQENRQAFESKWVY